MHSLAIRPEAEVPGRHLVRAGHLGVRIADRPGEVDEALGLRYRVFAGELGADLAACPATAGSGHRPGPGGAHQERDRDVFDAYCRHLIAVDSLTGRVVGTYRVLLPEQARQLGFLYADREFHLSWLNPIRHDLVELGRACIEPRYRNGVVLMLLWRAMRQLVALHGHQYVIGSCSVPVRDGGVYAASLYRHLAQHHLTPPNQRVWPRIRLAIETLAGQAAAGADGEIEVPPLLKAYLKAGARVLGEPHYDAQFGCADFPILLETRCLDQRLMARLDQSN